MAKTSLKILKLHKHGQSKANVAKIVVSRPENGIPSKGVGPPSPSSNSSEGKGWGLTEFGKEQVKNASRDLSNYFNNFQNQEIDDDNILDKFKNSEKLQKFHIKIYSSPFIRTVETANILLNELLLTNNNLSIHSEIIIHDDLMERNFGIFELKSDKESYSKVWKMDESYTLENEYKELQVETCEEVRSRICNVVNEIEREHHIIAILVSHGDPLQILQTAFENADTNLHRSLNHLEVAQWRIFGPR
ncbi:phosphoglycerate mutase-like protein [Rhizophagus irregularis]|nr:phosphoglycerate mutase-like protein [Rhizophagus irregularis]